METIEMRYCFKENGEVKEVNVCKKAEDGITVSEVCDMFLDFMKSAGFMEKSVIKFFQDEE